MSRAVLPVLAVAGALALAASATQARPGRPAETSAVRQARELAERGARRARSGGPRRGLVLGLYSDRDGESWEGDLDELVSLGSSHVLIVVQQAMTDVRANRIAPREWLTPSTPRLEAVLAGARERGLGVVLMPTLFIEHSGDGQWRGALEPESWEDWWRSYERFIAGYARLAERHGVEVFVAGSELCSTEGRREDWARLLLRLRRETGSLLAYSFNWDHLRRGRIADLFDLVGMNAYHDLAEGPATPEDRLREAWRPIREEVESWRRLHGRPLLFTEIGYRSVEVAEHEPWNYLWEQDYDGEAQARCYRAFLEAWRRQPELAGCFFYSWRGEGGAGDTGYTPKGKPAETVLRRWLGGLPTSLGGPASDLQETEDELPAAPAAHHF